MPTHEDRSANPLGERSSDNPLDRESTNNPLQPGNPFKTGNFNKFALGLAAAAIILGLLIAGYFLFISRNTEAPHSPPQHSLTTRTGIYLHS